MRRIGRPGVAVFETLDQGTRTAAQKPRTQASLLRHAELQIGIGGQTQDAETVKSAKTLNPETLRGR